MKLKSVIVQNAVNALAAKTKQKIVVIESDDWGSIRMPSRQVYDYLISKGIIAGDDPFLRFDSLERAEDLENLFEVLTSVTDSQGRFAKLTANCIVTNPDFAKIKAHDFQEYFFEPVADTFDRYPEHSNSLAMWHEGANNNIFIPQLHGREHVNVGLWLTALQEQGKVYREVFLCQTYAINSQIVAALGWNKKNKEYPPEDSVEEGHQIFIDIFGKPSESFIAPNYTWDETIEKRLYDLGIMYLQGSKKQNKPSLDSHEMKTKYHYAGQKNKMGQVYFVRNCLFEPSISGRIDHLDICLSQIKNAFYWNTPAVICSHRLNYVGHLDAVNRDENLLLLRQLLKSIVKHWPDVKFMSTADLIREMYLVK